MAVDTEVMDVYFAIRRSTCKFWMTNSLVGQMHSACTAAQPRWCTVLTRAQQTAQRSFQHTIPHLWLLQ